MTPPRLWVPVPTGYLDEATIRRAGPDAELIWLRSLAYAKDLLTDGALEEVLIDRILVGLTPSRARKALAALEDQGLWTRTATGWQVNYPRAEPFTAWNTPAAELEQRRTAKSTGGTLGNHRRWHTTTPHPECPWCDQPSDRTTDRTTDRPHIGPASPEQRQRQRQSKDHHQPARDRPALELTAIDDDDDDSRMSTVLTACQELARREADTLDASITSRVAWTRTRTRNLLADLGDQARTILTAHPDLTAHDLADELAGTVRARTRRRRPA